MYGKAIAALIRESAIAEIWDGRSGHWNGLVNGLNGVLSAGMRQIGPAGPWVFLNTTDEVTVADNPLLRLTAGGIIAVSERGFTSQITNEVVIAKRFGASSNYQLLFYATQIAMYDGAWTRYCTTSVLGARSIGCTFENGAIPIGYKNGLSVGNFTGTVSIVTNNIDVTIGNYGNSLPLRSPLSCLLLANRILTPTEYAQAEAELLAARWPSKQYSIGKRVQLPNASEAGLVGGWDMRPVNGVVVDAVGAHNGTIYGPVSRQGILGFEQSFDGTDDYINCGNVGSVKTLAFWCRPTTTTEDIIDMDGGTHTVEVTAGTLTATGWAAPTIYVDGAATTSLRAGLLQRVVIATATAFNATALQLGTETTFFDGQIGEVEVFSDEKSAAWVAADHLEGARAVQFKTDWGYNVSPADEGGVTGQQIGGNASPFRAGDTTGRWRIETDTIDGRTCKVLTCKTAGTVYVPASYFHAATPTEAAFGTWDYYVYHAAGTLPRMAFMSNTTANATTTGYRTESRDTDGGRVYLYVNGVGAVLDVLANVINRWSRFRVSRDLAGGFSVYHDGTLLGSATNAVTTTSLCMAFDIDAGDKIALGDTVGDHCISKMLGVVAP